MTPARRDASLLLLLALHGLPTVLGRSPAQAAAEAAAAAATAVSDSGADLQVAMSSSRSSTSYSASRFEDSFELSPTHAVQGGYDHLNLLLLKCRTRVYIPLHVAGRAAERAASRCVQDARDRLDVGTTRIERFLKLPAPSPELDAEIAIIQQGLMTRQRFPASSLIEKRAMRAFYSMPKADPALAPLRQAFSNLEAEIWEELSACLDRAKKATPRAALIIGKLYKCIEHRIGDTLDEEAVNAGIPPHYITELKRINQKLDA